MTLELILIRHGESVANLSPEVISGLSADTPLTPRGRMQAALLRNYFLEQGAVFDQVYVSPTERTKETARIVFSAHGNLQYTERLYELSRGDWTGKVRSAIYTPEVKQRIHEDPLNFKPPNGESSQEAEDRAGDFLEHDIDYRNRNGRIAVVGHAYFFKCALRTIMQFDPRFTWKIELDNTSMTKLRYDSNGWHLDYLNGTPHLSREKL